MTNKPTLNTTIRQATTADSVLLAEIGAQAFSETFSAENTPENMAAYLAAAFSPNQLAAELAHPAAVFLIAEVEGAAAGFAKLQATVPAPAITGPRPLELVRLYALNEWIGRGIGSALMRACLEEARQRGYETLWLGVWERNPKAHAFYHKWGFEKVGTHIFQLGDDPQTDWLMQRAVNAR